MVNDTCNSMTRNKGVNYICDRPLHHLERTHLGTGRDGSSFTWNTDEEYGKPNIVSI